MALELLKAYGSESSSEEELEGVQEESPILLCATATSTDSDEIVTNEPALKKRKLTKKEMKRISVANRCNDLLSRDDVIAVNRAFWDLDLHGQKSWIRQQVTRREVSRRSTNRFLFRLPTSEGSQVEVCRKKFLNAIGYGEYCGNIVYRCFVEGEDGLPVPSRRGKYKRDKSKSDGIEYVLGI